MKFRRLSAGFAATMLLAGLLSSCKGDKDIVSVSVPLNYSELTFNVRPTLLAGPYSDSITVTTNIDSVLETKKLTRDDINSIRIKSFQLIVEQGNEQNNFRIIQNLFGTISVDGKEPIPVGQVTNNPDVPSDTLNIEVDPTREYKDMLNGSTFKMKLTGNTRGLVTLNMRVKAKAKFNISASL